MLGPVYVAGLGPVGVSLARALEDRGVTLSGAHDRDAARAASASIRPVAATVLEPAALAAAETVVVAVSDSEIAGFAAEARAVSAWSPGQIWLHCSGAVGPEALRAIAGSVAGAGTLHPALVFAPGRARGFPPGTRFGVSGDPAAVERASRIASTLGGVPLPIPAGAGPAYHAALVAASNHLIALLARARETLEPLGMDPGEAEALLTGLAGSALEAAGELGLDASLSGPIRRGDVATVARNLEALRGQPAALELYRCLGRAALDIARRLREIDAGTLDRIARVLEGR